MWIEAVGLTWSIRTLRLLWPDQQYQQLDIISNINDQYETPFTKLLGTMPTQCDHDDTCVFQDSFLRSQNFQPSPSSPPLNAKPFLHWSNLCRKTSKDPVENNLVITKETFEMFLLGMRLVNVRGLRGRMFIIKEDSINQTIETKKNIL